eukprot:gene11648-21893_t
MPSPPLRKNDPLLKQQQWSVTAEASLDTPGKPALVGDSRLSKMIEKSEVDVNRQKLSCTKANQDENTKENNNPAGEEIKAEEGPAPGMLSRLAGGVYTKTATVVGGVTWVAGTAVTSTYGVMKGAGSYVNIWKKKEKTKSD